MRRGQCGGDHGLTQGDYGHMLIRVDEKLCQIDAWSEVLAENNHRTEEEQ